jgi:hypothetical protein
LILLSRNAGTDARRADLTATTGCADRARRFAILDSAATGVRAEMLTMHDFGALIRCFGKKQFTAARADSLCKAILKSEQY